MIGECCEGLYWLTISWGRLRPLWLDRGDGACNNGLYIFVITGEIVVAGEKLKDRDAIGVWETESISIKAHENSKIIIIEVPMN